MTDSPYVEFNTSGMSFGGWNSTDRWCLGDDDVHTNVCLEQQPFVLIDKQFNASIAQWSPPLRNYYRVNSILGIATSDPVRDPNGTMSFIQRAYDNGLIKYNTWSFSGITGDERYAAITLGGYTNRSISGEIEWYNSTQPV